MPLLDAEQVAAWLNVSRRWVYERTNSGELPTIRLGRYYRYEAGAVAAFIDRCQANAR